MLRTSLALLALASSAVAQSTWYVDDDGVAPGSGTQQDPYTSIAYAIAQPTTLAGDLVLVAPGSYAEKLAINFAKPLEVRSSDGPLVTHLQLPPGSSPAYTVTIYTFAPGPQGVLDGFSVRGLPGGYSGGVDLDGGLVRNCVVTGHAQNPANLKLGVGIHSEGFESFAERCTVVDCHVGINNTGSHYTTELAASNCVLAGNVVDVDSDGIDLSLVHSAWTTQAGQVSGSDNLVGEAGLWNPTQGDPRLGPGSVCIDSGAPSLPPDPDGSPADRGAVPYDAGYVPAPSFHCSAEPHGGGCQAPISLKGGLHASVSDSAPFRVEATLVVENVPGLLFYGTSGRTSLPFMGGELCMVGPLTRTAGQFSGSSGPGACKGFFVFDFNAYLRTPQGALIDPGTMVNAQYWFRDTSDLQWGAATTNAVEFAVAP